MFKVPQNRKNQDKNFSYNSSKEIGFFLFWNWLDIFQKTLSNLHLYRICNTHLQ